MEYENHTDTKAIVKWEKYTDMAPEQFVRYNFQVTPDITPQEMSNDLSLPYYELIDMTPATEYTVKVNVESRDFGQSEWSVGINLKTRPSKLSGNYHIQT